MCHIFHSIFNSIYSPRLRWDVFSATHPGARQAKHGKEIRRICPKSHSWFLFQLWNNVGDICHRVPAPWSSSSTTCKWNSWSCAFSESFPAYFFNSSKKMKISDKSVNQIDPPRSSNWDNCVNSRTSNCRNDSKFGEIISISSPKWNPLGSLILGPCLVHLGGTVRLRVTNITGRSYDPNWFQHRKHQTNQTIYFNHHISSYIIIYHHISSYIIIIFSIFFSFFLKLVSKPIPSTPPAHVPLPPPRAAPCGRPGPGRAPRCAPAAAAARGPGSRPARRRAAGCAGCDPRPPLLRCWGWMGWGWDEDGLNFLEIF